MKYLVFIVLFFTSSVFAQDIRSTKNVFGGYNYYNKGKLEVSSRKNVYGGYNYSGKIQGYSRPSMHGGYNYHFKENKVHVQKYIPYFKESK